MTYLRRERDPLVQSILKWANEESGQLLLADLAPGTDDRERGVLAALGGIARVVASETKNTRSEVPVGVSNWWCSAPTPPKDLSADVRRALMSGRDLFSEVYTAVVSTRHRRRLGTVFTPPAVTAYMLSQCEWLGLHPAVVIDPGAGVGAFTLGAASMWGVPVIAVDLNVVTLGFLAARCHLLGYETSVSPSQDAGTILQPPAIQLVLGDFLEWLPNGLSQTNTPALIIGNPPYTRHQGIDSKLKETAREVTGSLVSSGLAGMAAYFLAASLLHLRAADSLCLILPSSWMHAKYGSEIRRHLWNLTSRRVQLSVFPHDTEVFPQTKVDAVVLLVGPQEKVRCSFTLAEAKIRGTRVDHIRVGKIDRALEQPLRLPRSLTIGKPRSSHSARLRDSFGVHRGIATGKNSFFLLSDAEVEANRIPQSALVPAISSLKKTDADTIDDETFEDLRKRGMKRWLLMLGSSSPYTQALRRYLVQGARRGYNEGYLAKHRRHWFAVEDIPPAPLLLLPMTKREFRVVRNTIGVRHTNNLYGLYPLNNDVDVDGAARWLRSRKGQLELRMAANPYGGGAFKLEPRAVGNVEVPCFFDPV